MRLLVVEDDAVLARQLRLCLEEAGYSVDHAENGEDGLFLGETEPYDAIILDLGLPKIDGVSVLRQWRAKEKDVPVIVLTARASWAEKVDGLDAGADDYLAKPFQPEELLARLRALIRRSKNIVSPEIVCGPITLDPRSAEVFLDGRPVTLTANEFKVLSYLMHHRHEMISRSELIDHIYAQDFDRDSNTIEVFILRLRRKLGSDSIRTVRGLGYQMAWK
ncbi:MAG TPA: response regulator transcription factor [Candidatus Sulfotelmatobacter sp.]|nr:response regulator transcription factor [Candidatus Sulfotelmatobacter sp.]